MRFWRECGRSLGRRFPDGERRQHAYSMMPASTRAATRLGHSLDAVNTYTLTYIVLAPCASG